MAAKTRVGLAGSAAAYLGFTAKAAEFIPHVIVWTTVAYAAPGMANVAYAAPGLTSVAYIPE